MSVKSLLTLLLAISLTTLVAPALAGSGDPGNVCHNALDVIFVFDTTGSMSNVLNDARNGATAVMTAVQAQSPGAFFAVADYKDYPDFYSYPGYASQYGGFGDYPWRLVQPLTSSTAAAQAAINTLGAGGGSDWPESMTRAVYESYSDPAIGWRAGSIRVVILFTDAPAHDTNFNAQNNGGDPGPNAIGGDGDDLDFEATASAAGANGLRVGGIGVGANTGAPYLQHLASVTDGAYAPLGDDFVAQITDMILDLSGVVIGAHADAVLVDVTSYAGYNLDVAHVEAGPHNDAHDETLQTIVLPNLLNGYLKTGDGSAAVSRGTTERAASDMTIQEVSLLGGLIQARVLHADALVTSAGGLTTPDPSGSYVAQVVVNGIPITTSPGVSQPLPFGLGTIAINEQIVNQPAPDSAEVEVNMIHVRLTLPDGTIGDVKVGHAYAIISCQPLPHDDGPHAPIDPAVPTDPADPIPPTPCISTFVATVCPDPLVDWIIWRVTG